MKPRPAFPWWCVLFTIALLGGSRAGAQTSSNTVIISEFLASNTQGLKDEDGDTSDWIELYNPTASFVSLSGWSLTDNPDLPRRWILPSVSLSPQGRLVVFASGKNRTQTGSPLHTSFRLSAGGGYLALWAPEENTPASQFSYPRQFPDVSYGLGWGPSLSTRELLSPGASMRYLIPSSPVSVSWRGGEIFDDGTWNAGAFPAGYDRRVGPEVVAYVVAAGTPGNQAYSGSLGMDFEVLQPIELLELGTFDDRSDGIAAGTTVTVQLYRRNHGGTPDAPGDDRSGGVVATTNFTATLPGTLVGGSRFKPLNPPILLTNGSYTIVASGYGAKERLANLADGVSVVGLNTGEGAVRFTGLSRYSDSPRSFPTIVDQNVAQYGAGTFKFRTVPDSRFATSLDSMNGSRATVFVRVPFQVPADAPPTTLSLDVRYDDGFVAWLNGVEVARRNAPAALDEQSRAIEVLQDRESIDLTDAVSALRPGTNILAIQGLNVDLADDDFRLDLSMVTEPGVTGSFYFLYPTAGMPNNSGVRWPQILIHEIHSDPLNSKSVPLEFVELYNPLPTAVDVSGWSFTRGIRYTFPSGTKIQPRGYCVVAENPGVLQGRLGAASWGPWEGSLDNDGETLELADANGRVVDQISYGLGFPWPTVGHNDFSLQLIHPGLEHDLGASWRSGPPTPGRANAVINAIVPPAIRQVEHIPKQPRGGEVVVVTAKVTDPDGVASVRLEYQIVEPGLYLRLTDAAFTNQWQALEMRDGGLDGDERAGDGTYTVRLNSEIQKHRRLIRYRLKAVDVAGASVQVPYVDDPSPNFAYFVYDGVPAWTGAVQPGVTPLQTFGVETMRKVQAWHLLSRSNDVYSCQYDSAFNDTVYRFEGALVVGDKVYDHIRYRVKGQNSTYNTGKNKWKIKFNRGHWLEMPDDYGATSTRVELMNVSSLPSSWAPWNRGMAGLDEVMQYRLSNLVGVPAPRTTYFQLRVIDGVLEQPANTQYDGDLWGLYIGFENQDNRFKEAHELPDGNIFRMQSGNNHLLGQGKGQPTDLRDLNAFLSTSTGYNYSPTQPESWWRTNVDLQRYYSWRAVNEAVNNTDIRDQENVVYFRDPETKLWHIQPWDCDLLYEQLDRWGPEATQSQVPYEQIRRCLLQTNLMVEFQNRARELQDLLLNSDQAWKLVDEFVSLITDGGPDAPGFVEVDRRRWDFNPINPTPPRGVGPFGNYYKTPYPIPDMGMGPPQPFFRVLATPDFAGLVTWVKNFIALDAHGGGRLTKMAADSSIPSTPRITFRGGEGFAADDLLLETSGFQSPAGRAFSAMQWRLGEVADPSVPGFRSGQRWKYEVEEVWNSGALTSEQSTIRVPEEVVQEGRTYRARVRFRDQSLRWSHWSAPMEFTVSTPGIEKLKRNLVLTEIHYHPQASPTQPSEAYEFVELKNIGTQPLRVAGLRFVEGISYTFPPDAVLAAGQYWLLVRDSKAFAERYPDVSFQGIFAGRLDDGGEVLTLSHPSGGVVFSVRYSDSAPWPLTADGHGFSLVRSLETSDADPNDAGQWRASRELQGSPWRPDGVPTILPVFIDEWVANATHGQNFVELHNPHPTPVSLAHWYLSDDPSEPKKYAFPENAVIPAGGFRIVPESDFRFPEGSRSRFRLESRNGSLYLISANAQGDLTGYSHGVEWDAVARDEAWGRWKLSTGQEWWASLEEPTPGFSNTVPRWGPVIVSAIHYRPSPTDFEFVELANVSSGNVALFDGSDPMRTWRVRGLGFVLPPQISLRAGERLVICSTDPEVFRRHYGVPESIRILGPYAGTLQPGGETLALQRPELFEGAVWDYVDVDVARYSPSSPWPLVADGGGAALYRHLEPGLGVDPASWEAQAPHPGTVVTATEGPRIVEQPQDAQQLPGRTVEFRVKADGPAPLRYQWLHEQDPLPGATQSVLRLAPVSALSAGHYQVVVYNAGGSVRSREASLTLLKPLLLLVQPTNHFIRPGATARFGVVAEGSGPLVYQWLRNGVEIPGAQESTWVIPNVQPDSNGIYTCRIRDAWTQVTSTAAVLAVLVDPVIVQQPVSQETVTGGPLILSVTVTNSATLPLGYRLRRNGVLVPGSYGVSNERTFFFSLNGTNAAPPWTNYSIVVTNLARPGGITSSNALIRYAADLDKDGLADDWERLLFGDLAKGIPGGDDDLDGMSNAEEFVAGTHPLDPSSRLEIRVLPVPEGILLEWEAVSNRTYRVEFLDGLGALVWQPLLSLGARSTNRLEQWVQPLGEEDRFYRLRTPAIP